MTPVMPKACVSTHSEASICARKGCGRAFVPTVPWQRFCSNRCRYGDREDRNPRVSQLALFSGAPEAPEPPSPEQRRDQALERVSARAGDFIARGLELIRRLPGGELTGEDIRHLCERANIRPHHYNAWGALCMAARRQGLLRKTGRYRSATDPRKHAHANPIYEIRGGSDG